MSNTQSKHRDVNLKEEKIQQIISSFVFFCINLLARYNNIIRMAGRDSQSSFILKLEKRREPFKTLQRNNL